MRTLPRPRSLSGRVTLTALVLLTAILLVLFTAVDITLSARLNADVRTRLTDRVALAQQLDGSLSAQQLVDQLRGEGVTAELCSPSAGRDGADNSGTAGPEPQSSGVGEQTGARCVVAAAAPAPPGVPGPRGTGGPKAAARRAARDVAVRTSGSVLFTTATLSDGQLLTLSSDTTQITTAVQRLLGLEVVGGAVALLLAGLLLSRLSRVALRPLDDMTALARQIAAGDRGRRLNTGHPDSELGRTATAFDAMLHELEQAAGTARSAEKRMREFLGDASHELRTPLAGLQANAENLLRLDPDRQERERTAVAMIRETQRAARLVEDLLTVARLDQGQELRREDVDLVTVALAEVDRARLLGPDRHFTVLGDPVAVVSGDRLRLGQVLANLLDTARHATRPGGRVTVHVGHAAGADGQQPQVTATVCDTGPGVPAAERERIFTRFARLDTSRSRETGGAGLGLPIARGLARALGGDLTYELREGNAGACFVLTVPAAPAPAPARLGDPAPQTADALDA